MKLFFFYLLQWTWGLSQNIVGGIGYLALRKKHRSESYHGARVMYIDTDKRFGGVSIGMFVFIKADAEAGWTHDTRIHEVGHCVQSILLGPLYWIVVALPSVLWCNLPVFRKHHNTRETSHNYYKLYCEGWANTWGVAWTGDDFISERTLKGAYYGKPWDSRKK